MHLKCEIYAGTRKTQGSSGGSLCPHKDQSFKFEKELQFPGPGVLLALAGTLSKTELTICGHHLLTATENLISFKVF